jgi:hypothetical protein
MEALLMEDQGQPGLNIVCEETTRPTKSKRKVKKYNKYEKRRAKERLAKKAIIQRIDQSKIDAKAVDMPTNDSEKEQDVEEEDVLVKEAEEEIEMIHEQPPPLTETQDTAMKSPSPSLQQPPAQASRKVHTETLKDEQERARYLAEFHARPMEMDHCSGATWTIAPSVESRHLFDSLQPSFDGLLPRITASLTKMGVEKPTLIQTRAIQALRNDINNNIFIQVKREVAKHSPIFFPFFR